ncbi:MAG TPA: hypothetical protein VHW74_07485 [Mycobacteriales bacterium]|nr:hypothetical protein [Mycobacteriales bacterium]
MSTRHRPWGLVVFFSYGVVVLVAGGFAVRWNMTHYGYDRVQRSGDVSPPRSGDDRWAAFGPNP